MNSTDFFKLNETNGHFQNSVKSPDLELLQKVNQICELTGCSHDLALTALYDCENRIDVAIDKIFETAQKSDDWCEVAKNKKKLTTSESTNDQNTDMESKEDDKVTMEKPKFSRGRGRGRNNRVNGRNSEAYDGKFNREESNDFESSSRSSMTRGRGRRQPYRNAPNRGRPKPRSANQNEHEEVVYQDNIQSLEDKWPTTTDEWLNENVDVKSNEWVDAPITTVVNDCEELSNQLNCALTINEPEVNSCYQAPEAEKKKHYKSESPKISDSSAEIVAKSSSKDEIFGDFSRTKPPPPCAVNLSEPVKLLTSTGVVSATSKPEFNFSFGFNFNEYSGISSTSENPQSFISNTIHSSDTPVKQSEESNYHIMKTDGFNSTESHIRRKPHDSGSSKKSNDIFSNSSTSPGALDLSDKKSNIGRSSFSQNKPSLDSPSDTPLSLPVSTTILSTSPQLLPPPGMSNPHMLQQFQNSSQFYPMLNIPNGSQLYNSVQISEISENHASETNTETKHSTQSNHFLPEVSKEHNNQKQPLKPTTICSVNSSSSNMSQNMISKMNDIISTANSEPIVTQTSAILSTQHIPPMPVPINCYLSQMFMNNFSNFIPPPVHGHTNSSQASSELPQSSTQANKSIQYHHMQQGPRNYPISSDEFMDSPKYDEMIQLKQQQQKYRPPHNFSQNYGSKEETHDSSGDKPSKLSSAPSQPQITRGQTQSQMGPVPINRVAQSHQVTSSQQQHQQHQHQQQQQSMSNEPRRMAYHYPPSSHPYNNSIYNCVTAAGPHPSASHPYAMAPQANGMQPLHAQLLMQQHMNNFQAPYQFSEHLMNTMVSNSNTRNSMSQSSGSSISHSGGPNSGATQSRNNRSNNQNLWHPSN